MFYFYCVLGNVGPPLPCNWMKVVDIPEMGYFADNGEGEVFHIVVVKIRQFLLAVFAS